ncbi:hypothetical protein NDU88_005524 [Pleurodeles waltl]|uniref:Uncharacterized protein n=1 Tax=Pleurodeles waltl TaxID=8319 RepID=A0AAV7VK44_PLEWA|nr:hypothetical protein NDU88_005524 [Pleurodeles waltl]
MCGSISHSLGGVNVIGRQDLSRDRSAPGGLDDFTELRRKRRAFFKGALLGKRSQCRYHGGWGRKGRKRPRTIEEIAARNRRRWRKTEASRSDIPGDAEPRDRNGEFQLSRGETRQPRREELAGEEGGRESAGTGHVLGRKWPEQVQGVY